MLKYHQDENHGIEVKRPFVRKGENEMKDKKNIGIKILGAACVIVIVICILFQGMNTQDGKKPTAESQIAEALIAETEQAAPIDAEKEEKKDEKNPETKPKRDESLIVETGRGNKIETEYLHIDDKFYLKIPKEFSQLDDEIISEKYGGDVPDIVFSNEEINVNIAISLTENPMQNSQIEEYKDFMVSLFKGYGEIVSTDYYNVADHHVGQIKLISDAVDTQVYNHMIFFSYNDKLVIVTFNCTLKLKDEWETVGDFIIDSLLFEG